MLEELLQEEKTCIKNMDKGSHIQWNITRPLKKDEILPFAMTWMDLEVIMPSEISQTEKDKYRMISLICGI